jgi:sugar O-acyltransferase (sialic acid O-acetyltransferase NeuD family)
MKEIKKLIIFGDGKFSEFIAYSFQQETNFIISAFCLEKEFISSNRNIEFNVPMVSFENVSENYPPEEYYFFITVGNDSIRERIFKSAKHKGYKLPNFISPNSIIPKNLKLEGENIFIGEGSALQPYVKIKSNTILLSAKVGHHSKINENCLLSVCLIGAEVEIGRNTFIGLNATVRSKVFIADKNIIGMGCNITKDTKPREIYSTSPAKRRNLKYEDIADNFL